MKLKLDENGNVIVQDGKPVYVYDDGKELAFDAAESMAKISQLNAEAKNHREAKEHALAQLKQFDGIDADKAKQAMATVQNLDDKKLIDAGEVEKVKAEAKKAFDEQLASKDAEIAKINTEYRNAVIGGAFARSNFIKEKTLLPADIAQNTFGQYFEMTDGKIVGKLNGNPIYSRINPGELADFDEAFEQVINQYPNKADILRGSSGSGAGASQPGFGAGSIKSFADAKTTEEKIAWLKAKNGE
ncbi:DUF6651 domain-containing protein [Moraxella sp. ZJ142]|uniref:DUF6651 domain-containing protein n=1 Tax=Moraxella marmotae TaxID=3344520 RepID=UPI0035D4264C